MILEGLHEKDIFTDDFPIRVAVNTQENYDYPSHWHNAVELVYSAKNSCFVKVNNKKFVLEEKDILIISAADIHSFHVHNSKGIRFLIQFDFTKLQGLSDSAASNIFMFQTQLISQSKNTSLHGDIEKHITQIINEHEKKSAAYDLFLNARILDIMVILSRGLTSEKKLINKSGKTNQLAKLDKAFKYLEENYKNEITLKDIANSAGFSEFHFSRVFKKATEKTFHIYLNEYRIKKAEKLLLDPNVNIAQTAYASGFNSIVTFNRTFKQIKGCSPTEFIKLRI